MDRNKNVLHFMVFAPPYGGNFLKSLLRLELRLSKAGTKMVYLFERETADVPWAKELISEGKTVYFLSGNKFKDVATIYRILKKHKITIIHTHFTGVAHHSLFTVVRRLIGQNLKIIRHLHNHYPKNTFVIECVKRALSHIDLYIGCGQSVATHHQQLNNLPAEKVVTVPNAIDFSRLNAHTPIDREAFHLDKSTKTILIFGFDYYRKGVDLALEAVADMISQGIDTCLFISLSTNKDFVMSKIRERYDDIPIWVRILDPRDDIASYYMAFDIFISPSRSEGFCYSVLEAAYCGMQIVVSNIPGQRLLNIPYVAEFESGNVQDLKQKLIEAFSVSDDEINKRAKLEQAHIVKTYDLNAWAQQIHSIYNRISAS